jgi:dipeptidyl aminopeptidase/acylaminoacyl peptidase
MLDGAPVTTAARPAVSYAGHGEESVPREVLARYAPKPLQDATARSVQSVLDLRPAASGMVGPKGKTMYFTWSVTGVAQVWRLNGPNQFPTQMTGGSDVTRVEAVAPNGAYVVIARDRKGEENPGLYLLDARGGGLRLVQHTPKVQSEFALLSEDGRYVYFRANDQSPKDYALYRYDTRDGKRETLYSAPGIWLIRDRRPDGRLLVAKEVGSNMQEYFEWSPDTREMKPLFGQGEREDYVAQYGAKDGQILVQTSHFDEFRRIYTWESGKFTPALAARNADATFGPKDPSGRTLLVHYNQDGYTRLEAYDAKTFKALRGPTVQADHVSATSMSPDGQFVSLAIDPGDAPPASAVWDTRAGTLTTWQVGSAPELETGGFVKPKLSSYQARDGAKIPMFVWEPQACATTAPGAAPCPVVVMFHGGPEGQTLAGFSRTAQVFTRAGFIFVAPNVRGSDGYGKTWLHADDGPRRLNVITDIEDAGKHVRALYTKQVAPKVGVFGGSYGGYSTLMAMTRFAGTYDAGVSVVGISSLYSFLMNTAPYRRILRISEYGDPEKDRAALDELSAITHVKKLKAPLLMIQGASDPRVPIGEALQMYDAAKSTGVPTDLIVFEGEGHGAQKRENKVLELGHSVAWFEKYLR